MFPHAQDASVFGISYNVFWQWALAVQYIVGVKIIGALCHNFQVFQSVISLVPILVIYRELCWRSDECFGHEAMNVAHRLLGILAQRHKCIAGRQHRMIPGTCGFALPTSQAPYVSRIAYFVRRESFYAFPCLHDSSYKYSMPQSSVPQRRCNGASPTSQLSPFVALLTSRNPR